MNVGSSLTFRFEPCHTYKCVTHTYKRVISHVRMRHVTHTWMWGHTHTHMNVGTSLMLTFHVCVFSFVCVCKGVGRCVGVSDMCGCVSEMCGCVTRMSASCHTYECVMSHMWMCLATHTHIQVLCLLCCFLCVCKGVSKCVCVSDMFGCVSEMCGCVTRMTASCHTYECVMAHTHAQA